MAPRKGHEAVRRAAKAEAKAPGLKKSLGLLDATMYGVGIILGAGIYALLGAGAGLAGNSIWVSFVIGAFVAVLTGLSYCELSSMVPREAAEYNYTKKAFGGGLAFLVGWVLLFSMIIAASTVSIGFAGYFAQLFSLPVIPAALALLVVLTALNMWGIKESSKFNIVATLIESAGLVIVIILGAVFFNPAVDLTYSPNGFPGIMAGAVLMFFAFIGFEDVANISEETKDAKRVIPKALLLSILISTVLYILVAVAAVGIAGWEALYRSEAPMSMILGSTLGPGAAAIMSIIALFSTSNTVLVSLLVASRMMYGMARDSSLPRALSKVHPKTGTPYVAVIATLAVSAVFVLIGDLSLVASLTTASIFIAYIFVNGSLIRLRYTAPKEERVFRVPFSIGRFPVIAGLGLATSLVMLLYSDIIVLGAQVLLILAGAAVHFAYRKKLRGR